MRKLLVTAIAVIAMAGLAHAGQTQGTVAAVDPATRTITLQDGQSFVAADGVEIEALATGQQVMVTFDDATNQATAVEAM